MAISRRSVIIAAIGGSILLTGRASAQSFRAIDVILEKKIWREFSEFERLRKLTGSLITIRNVYNGPNGYEGKNDFAAKAFAFRRSALGKDPKSGFEQLKIWEEKEPIPDMQKQMLQMLEKNRPTFVSWLAEIGIQKDSLLQNDLVNAQALFALSAAHTDSDKKLSSFSNFTWIYPFC